MIAYLSVPSGTFIYFMEKPVHCRLTVESVRWPFFHDFGLASSAATEVALKYSQHTRYHSEKAQKSRPSRADSPNSAKYHEADTVVADTPSAQLAFN
jgi:hypothetical protein